MPRYHFLQLDVFTRSAFGGNQLAVFTDARGLRSEQMQTLTREMNFSECTFLLPPTQAGTAKQVRIFTPAVELPMAGHPTVGSAAALVHTGMATPENGSLVLELGIGPVRVDIEPRAEGLPFVWMYHRKPVYGPRRLDRAATATALGLAEADIRSDLPLEVVSTGVPFLFVPLVSLDAMRRAQSEAAPLARLFTDQDLASVALFTDEVVNREARFHARMYSPHVVGITEDPATGSMAAPFGAYAARYGLLGSDPRATFLLEQGLEMGRPSQIMIDVQRAGAEISTLRIGGDSVLVGEGDLFWT